nr:DUF167 domain-containing protein [Hydrogenophaga sp. YM1]
MLDDDVGLEDWPPLVHQRWASCAWAIARSRLRARRDRPGSATACEPRCTARRSQPQDPLGSWTARLKSPPVDGKANEELIALVARRFGCAKAEVGIKTGASGRRKRLVIGGA